MRCARQNDWMQRFMKHLRVHGQGPRAAAAAAPGRRCAREHPEHLYLRKITRELRDVGRDACDDQGGRAAKPPDRGERDHDGADDDLLRATTGETGQKGQRQEPGARTTIRCVQTPTIT